MNNNLVLFLFIICLIGSQCKQDKCVDKGKKYYFNKSYEKAINSFKDCIKKDSGASLYWIGLTYKDMMEYNKSLKYLNKSLRVEDVDSFEVRFVRGVVYSDINKFEKALKDYNYVLRKDSLNYNTLNNKGLALLNLGKENRAYKVLRKNKSYYPDSILVHVNLGNVAEKKGDYSEAISHYNNAISLDSSFSKAYYFKGIALKEMGQDSLAIENFKLSIEKNPEYSEAYMAKGVLEIKNGNKNQACEDWKKASKLQSETARKYYKKYCED